MKQGKQFMKAIMLVLALMVASYILYNVVRLPPPVGFPLPRRCCMQPPMGFPSKALWCVRRR